MLVHIPLASWLLTLASDVGALTLEQPFFWRTAALLCAVGVGAGVLAAMFGAMDLERLKGRKDLRRIATFHASLMGGAWTLSFIALIGRIDASMMARVPAPLWAAVLDGVAVLLLLAGAFFGGELVYGHGVGVRRPEQND